VSPGDMEIETMVTGYTGPEDGHKETTVTFLGQWPMLPANNKT